MEHYLIRVRGHLDQHWATWFEQLTLLHAEDGTTVLDCWVTDEAALFAILNRVRDLHLPLLELRRQSSTPTGDDDPGQLD